LVARRRDRQVGNTVHDRERHGEGHQDEGSQYRLHGARATLIALGHARHVLRRQGARLHRGEVLEVDVLDQVALVSLSVEGQPDGEGEVPLLLLALLT
jgi:hypothetical protein